MLSLFPDLLDWSWNVPFIFRVYLGVYALLLAYRLYKKGASSSKDSQNWYIVSFLSLVVGAGYLIGLFVQALGAVGFVGALVSSYMKRSHNEFFADSFSFYALLSLVSLSLIFLGAGPHAIDLPL